MSSSVTPVDSKLPDGPVGSFEGSSGRKGQGQFAPGTVSAAEGLTQTQVEALVEQLNNAMQAYHTSLKFSVDASTKQIVITVMNDTTHEIIRQIPTEEALRIASHISQLLGILVDEAK